MCSMPSGPEMGVPIAYSTADSVSLSPGWRAHNDLWVDELCRNHQDADSASFVQRAL